MEKKTWTITLPDGTTINDLERNCDCFISETALPEMTGTFTEVTATAEGEDTKTWQNAEYLECASIDDRHWFTFRELSERELTDMQIASKLEYLAMMVDVDLAEV